MTNDASAETPAVVESPVCFYGIELGSRLMLGTARFPSPAILSQAVQAARLRKSSRCRCGASRRSAQSGQAFWSIIRELGVRVLPNTAGCRTVKEAVTTAHMAREVFGTPWIKLEVIGEDDTLQPDVFGLVEAARMLSARRLRGVSVHDGGSRRRGQADRCRVPRAHAVGLAHRLRARAQQRVRPEGAARAFPRRAAGHRRRHRRCLRTQRRRWSWDSMPC